MYSYVYIYICIYMGYPILDGATAVRFRCPATPFWMNQK